MALRLTSIRLTCCNSPGSRAWSIRRPAALISKNTILATYSNPRRLQSSVTSTGSDDTGHIRSLQNEGILFIQNVTPPRLSNFLPLPIFTRQLDSYISSWVKRLNIPQKDDGGVSKAIVEQATSFTNALKITDILPRGEEGVCLARSFCEC